MRPASVIRRTANSPDKPLSGELRRTAARMAIPSCEYAGFEPPLRERAPTLWGLKGCRGIQIRLRFRAVNFPVPPNDFFRVLKSLKTGYMAIFLISDWFT